MLQMKATSYLKAMLDQEGPAQTRSLPPDVALCVLANVVSSVFGVAVGVKGAACILESLSPLYAIHNSVGW
jgi:hypothetical protein